MASHVDVTASGRVAPTRNRQRRERRSTRLALAKHYTAVFRGSKSFPVKCIHGCRVFSRGLPDEADRGLVRVDPADESDEENNDDEHDAEDDDGAVVAVDGGLQGLQLRLQVFCCVQLAQFPT